MKWPGNIRDEARDEVYEYFDKKIRPLHKTPDGKVDPSAKGLEDNDVDAFRHAYVSGVFAQEYGEKTADLFGLANEFLTADLYSNQKNPKSLNMDLWNNAIGRKYGLKTKERKELLKMIHKALENGELITNPSDKRKYEGKSSIPKNNSKPIIVLLEGKKGRNELFYDTVKQKILSADQFIALIESGEYPGYAVKEVHGILTPVSKPDSRETNNLG